MKSRRKFRRLTIMGLGRITVEGERKSQEVYIANVSRGGVGLYLNKPIKVDTLLTITFPYPEETGLKENQTKTATVVWCKRFGGVYAMGIRFAG